jgi:ribosomal protein L11 methyltransferase
VLRLAVRVRREDAEAVLAELLALAPGGVEEAEPEAGVVEYAIYGPPGEVPDLPDLEAAAGDALVTVTTTEVADDWADRWRLFHQPVVVADRLHVRPPWCDAHPSLPEIVIDPGQAFGTGAHGTTRLCLELLCDLPPAPAMDLGCGSGVLAIAAAKLGCAPVAGVDHEAASVEATADNARANGVEVAVSRFDLLREGPVPSAPLTFANLLRPLLLAVCRAGFRDGVPERLIASGLLVDQGDEVAAAFERRHGLREVARRDDGEWCALLLERA